MSEFTNYPLFEAWFPYEKYSDLTMYHYGRHHCQPNYSVGPMMVWGHYLFHYVISGKGTFYSTDDSGVVREYNITSGQGFMIWPGQHCTYTSDKDEPWEYAWVEFDGNRAEETILKAGLQYNHPVYICEDASKRDYMISELIWIVSNSSKPSMELIGHFHLFLSALVQSSAHHNLVMSEEQQETHLQKATDYIMQNYHRHITVQEIADFCGVHRSYLFQIFTASLKLSPLQFLINYRIRKAGELLRTTNYSIGEVSLMVGYPNQMNFARAFKRVTGFTPIKWKKDIASTKNDEASFNN